MFCTTTDPYMVFTRAHSPNYTDLNKLRHAIVRRCLTLIRDKSTLKVRILTRSGAATQDFDLFQSFGNRLTFGMSIATLNDEWSRVYEPYAPAPASRMKTLTAARDAGLHVYVAVAPTLPDSDEAELRQTLRAVKEVNPITVFHEPINIRAQNVARIQEHARTIGTNVNLGVFDNHLSWAGYALNQLHTVQRLAGEEGLLDRLKLWPDPDLHFSAKTKGALTHPDNFFKLLHGADFDGCNATEEDRTLLRQHQAWVESWWAKVSEWPGKAQTGWKVPDVPEFEIA